MKYGCIIMNLKPCVNPRNITTISPQSSTNGMGESKPRLAQERLAESDGYSFLGTQMVLHDFLEPGTIINTERYTATFKTMKQ
jgi:hypothetical protein